MMQLKFCQLSKLAFVIPMIFDAVTASSSGSKCTGAGTMEQLAELAAQTMPNLPKIAPTGPLNKSPIYLHIVKRRDVEKMVEALVKGGVEDENIMVMLNMKDVTGPDDECEIVVCVENDKLYNTEGKVNPVYFEGVRHSIVHGEEFAEEIKPPKFSIKSLATIFYIVPGQYPVGYFRGTPKKVQFDELKFSKTPNESDSDIIANGFSLSGMKKNETTGNMLKRPIDHLTADLREPSSRCRTGQRMRLRYMEWLCGSCCRKPRKPKTAKEIQALRKTKRTGKRPKNKILTCVDCACAWELPKLDVAALAKIINNQSLEISE